MPIVKADSRYVIVAYELCCGCERAQALASDLVKLMQNDPGLNDAKDDTRGWDGPKLSVVIVYYRSLADAVRLDAHVRSLLGRNVDFTYDPNPGTAYGSRGPELTLNPITTVQPRA